MKIPAAVRNRKKVDQRGDKRSNQRDMPNSWRFAVMMSTRHTRSARDP